MAKVKHKPARQDPSALLVAIFQSHTIYTGITLGCYIDLGRWNAESQCGSEISVYCGGSG